MPTFGELPWYEKAGWIGIAVIFVGFFYLSLQNSKIQAYAHTLPDGKRAITAHFAFPPAFKTMYLQYNPAFEFEECIVTEYRGSAIAPNTYSVGKPAAEKWVGISTRGIGLNVPSNLWKLNVTFVNPSVDPATFLQAVQFRYLVINAYSDIVSYLRRHRTMSIEPKIIQGVPPPAL